MHPTPLAAEQPSAVAETLLALRSIRLTQYQAQAREYELLASYADLCHEPIDDARDGQASVLFGEQSVDCGDDGTPTIAEFAPLELAALWNENVATVHARIGRALTLRERFPHLWTLLLDAALPRWVADRIAELARDLPQHLALQLDQQLAASASGLPISRLLALTEGLVLQLTPPEIAAERREAEPNGVWVKHRRRAGTATGRSLVIARLNSPDAANLDLAVRRLAHILRQGGDGRELDDRRAQALGILALPACALQLLQASLLDELPTDLDAEPCPAAGQSGHLCGQITVDPDKLLPRAEVVVHLTDAAIADTVLTGTAHAGRSRTLGPLSTTWLAELFQHHRITVRPTIDTPGMQPVDSYEIPTHMRDAVHWRNKFDAFPGSTISAERCDLDHTVAYQFGYQSPPPHGQTNLGNLAPLSRTAHRAKTFSGWQTTQIHPGILIWRSPTGFIYLVTPSRSLLVHHPGAATRADAA